MKLFSDFQFIYYSFSPLILNKSQILISLLEGDTIFCLAIEYKVNARDNFLLGLAKNISPERS